MRHFYVVSLRFLNDSPVCMNFLRNSCKKIRYKFHIFRENFIAIRIFSTTCPPIFIIIQLFISIFGTVSLHFVHLILHFFPSKSIFSCFFAPKSVIKIFNACIISTNALQSPCCSSFPIPANLLTLVQLKESV